MSWFSQRIVLVALLTVNAPAIAAAPKDISPADLTQDLLAAKQAIAIGLPPGDFVVEGERTFNGGILAVDRLVFKPGARLVFTAESLKSRDSLLIVAHELVGLDRHSPGTITWDPPARTTAVAPIAGQGASGASGVEDHDGTQGVTGAAGNEGSVGRDAPRLTILVPTISAVGLQIDFTGQGGGKGGTGQKGGDGGNGGGGHSGSQKLFECSRGPGNGGNGGVGGGGGTGGRGGTGGHGGIVQLGSLVSNLPDIEKALSTNVSGGKGGTGGDGGDGGTGGLGGPVGAEQLPYCRRDGRHDGAAGRKGRSGQPGLLGREGDAGQYLFAPLTPENFEWLFSRSK